MDPWGEYIRGYNSHNTASCTYCGSRDTVTLCEHEKCKECCECGSGGKPIPPTYSPDDKYCDECGGVWDSDAKASECSVCGHFVFRVTPSYENPESSSAGGKHCDDCGEPWKSCADGSNLGCWCCTDLSHRELNPDDQDVITYDNHKPSSNYDNISYSRVNWSQPTLEISQQSAPEVEKESEFEPVPAPVPELDIVNDEEYEAITKALNRQVARGLASAANADSDLHSDSKPDKAPANADPDTDSEPDETPTSAVAVSDKIKNDMIMLRALAPVALMIQEIYNLRTADGNPIDDAGEVSLDGIRAIFKFNIERNAILVKLPFMGLLIPIQIVCAPYMHKSNLDDLCVYLKQHIAKATGETITNISEFVPFRKFYGQLMQFSQQLVAFYRHHLVNIIPADYFDRLPPHIMNLHVNHVGPTLYLLPAGLHLHFEYMINLINDSGVLTANP